MKITFKEIFEKAGIEYKEKYFTEEIFKKIKVKIDENKSFYLKPNFDKIGNYLSNLCHKKKIITEQDLLKIYKLLSRIRYKECSLTTITQLTGHTPQQLFPETNSLKTIGLIKKIGIINYKILEKSYEFDLIENIDIIIKYIESIKTITIPITKEITDDIKKFLFKKDSEYKKQFYYNLTIEKLNKIKDFHKEEITIKKEEKEIDLIEQIDKIKEALEFRKAFSEYTKEELLELIKQKKRPEQTLTIKGHFNFIKA